MVNGLIRLYGVKAGRLVSTQFGLVESNEDLGDPINTENLSVENCRLIGPGRSTTSRWMKILHNKLFNLRK
jgi:hypothetical protein